MAEKEVKKEDNTPAASGNTLKVYLAGIFAPLLLLFMPLSIAYRVQQADSILGWLHVAILVVGVFVFYDAAKRNTPAMIKDIRRRFGK